MNGLRERQDQRADRVRELLLDLSIAERAWRRTGAQDALRRVVAVRQMLTEAQGSVVVQGQIGNGKGWAA